LFGSLQHVFTQLISQEEVGGEGKEIWFDK
jgi:hypothetical protein